MAVRIHVVRAREAPKAVVFRRGPTKQVRLVAWNTETDAFERGQWLAGRVYERRSGLSPSGELLVYFGIKRGKTFSCVSRPPLFTPLLVWPGSMGSWGGGGWFASDTALCLNHWPESIRLADGFAQPEHFSVGPAGPGSGRGEDHPVEYRALIAAGWVLLERGQTQLENGNWTVEKSEIYAKLHPERPLRLERRLVAIFEANGPLYTFEYTIHNTNKVKSEPLGRLDWADWDANGDLLYATQGQIFRTNARAGWSTGTRIADFREDLFERMPPPEWATRWPASAGPSARSLIDRAEGQARIGAGALSEGDFETAVRLLSQYVGRVPARRRQGPIFWARCRLLVEAHHHLGLQQIDQGACDAALQAFDAALRVFPDLGLPPPVYSGPHVGKGNAFAHRGRHDEALPHYDAAIEIEPDNFYAWSAKGSSLSNLGRHAEALPCYDRAIEIEPRYWHPHYCRACTLTLSGGDRKEILAAVSKVLELDPRRHAMLSEEPDLVSLRGDDGFEALVAKARTQAEARSCRI